MAAIPSIMPRLVDSQISVVPHCGQIGFLPMLRNAARRVRHNQTISASTNRSRPA